MAKAYLLGKLSENTFPPFLEDVKITSQAATQMAGGLWVEFFHTDGEDFGEALELMRRTLNMPHLSARFEFAHKMISTDGMVDAPGRNRVISAAIDLAMLLRK